MIRVSLNDPDSRIHAGTLARQVRASPRRRERYAYPWRRTESATFPMARIPSLGRGGRLSNLENLAIVHGRCNWEKGVRWDPKKRRSAGEYDSFVARLVDRRKQRWREGPAHRLVNGLTSP